MRVCLCVCVAYVSTYYILVLAPHATSILWKDMYNALLRPPMSTPMSSDTTGWRLDLRCLSWGAYVHISYVYTYTIALWKSSLGFCYVPHAEHFTCRIHTPTRIDVEFNWANYIGRWMEACCWFTIIILHCSCVCIVYVYALYIRGILYRLCIKWVHNTDIRSVHASTMIIGSCLVNLYTIL